MIPDAQAISQCIEVGCRCVANLLNSPGRNSYPVGQADLTSDQRHRLRLLAEQIEQAYAPQDHD